MPDLSYESIEMNTVHGPFDYPWRERVDRYLEAVGNGFAWHGEASPWGPGVAPPAILGNATLRFIDSIAPIPPGTMHAKLDLRLSNALRRDRELAGYGQFEQKYERRGRRWFVFSARWRDGSGLLVGHCAVTMAFPEQVETPDEPERHERRWKPGEAELRLTARKLTQEAITAYAEDSANALRGQSIHTDAALARKMGFPNSVAQGNMSADYISELMTEQFQRGWLLNGKLSLAFVRPVFCEDTLTAKAAPRDDEEEGAFTRRVFDVWCENQGGEAVTVGTASAVVPAG
jgi:acyl dehydratase